jgi:hypothetical protein
MRSKGLDQVYPWLRDPCLVGRRDSWNVIGPATPNVQQSTQTATSHVCQRINDIRNHGSVKQIDRKMAGTVEYAMKGNR